MKTINKLIFYRFLATRYLLLATFYLLLATNCFAINMESSLFKIQIGDIEYDTNSSSTNTYSIDTSLGPISTQTPFTFSISKNYINFGALSPNHPTYNDTKLRVSFFPTGNYQVTAIEEGEIRTMDNNNYITDTSCNRDNKCDETNANVWNSKTAFGFGYKLKGINIPSTFTQRKCSDNCYRRFPNMYNLPTPEDPVIIMSNNNMPNTYDESIITFQINVPQTQKNNTYQTIINFIATPGY